MEKLIDCFENRDMFDFTINPNKTLTVAANGKQLLISEGGPGVYTVSDQTGKHKEKTFYPSEAEVTDYIISELNRADDRDICYRPIGRYLLINPNPRTLIGSFNTDDEAKARVDEINEYAAECGDDPADLKIIDTEV